ANDPIHVTTGDIIHYYIQASNKGNPITPLYPESGEPDTGHVVYADTWQQKNAGTGNATGGKYWSYSVTQAKVWSGYASSYSLQIPYELKAGVYESVSVPIGHYVGTFNQSGHNNNWYEDSGTRSITVSLYMDAVTGTPIWTGTFSGDTYGAINGSASGKNRNNSGKAPVMLTNFNLNYANGAVNFGNVVMPEDGKLILVMKSNRWRDYRKGIGGDYLANYGFVVGTMNVQHRAAIMDTLPAGLTVATGSAVIKNADGSTTTSGISVTGRSDGRQMVSWSLNEIVSEDVPALCFDTNVANPGTTLLNLYNSASVQMGAASGTIKVDSNTTYHLLPGPVGVTERYVDYLTGDLISPPLGEDGSPAGTVTDGAGNALSNPGQVIVQVGQTYTGEPPDSVVRSGGSGSVSYDYEGYFWDNAPAKWAPSGLALTSGRPTSREVGIENHIATYVYKDARGYPFVTEKYRMYDAEHSAPTTDPVTVGGDDKPDTKTELAVGDEYELPQSRTQDIKDGAASYTYVGYSTDGGATVHKDGVKYPEIPLWENLGAGESHQVILYFAGNPVYTAHFRLCDLDGNPLGGGSPAGSVPQGMAGAPGGNAGKPDEVSAIPYGDPLYFSDSYANPVKGTYTKDADGRPIYSYYKYYGYKIGSGSITAGTPSDSTLSAALTRNYEITLYYVDAKQVKVKYVEKGNEYHTLKSPTLINKRTGESVPASALAGCLADIDVTEDFESATPDARTYTYQGYEWDDMDEAADGEPIGADNLQSDRELTLYFSTEYTLTLRYHTNVTPSDDASNPVMPQVLSPDRLVQASGGSAAPIDTPPQGIRFNNKVWNYAGYKDAGDGGELTSGPPTSAGGAATASWGAFGPMWSDAELILAYDPDPSARLYTVTAEAAPTTKGDGSVVYGGAPSAESAGGTPVTDGLVAPVTARVDNIKAGETVTIGTTENEGFEFSGYAFYDGDGNEIDSDAIRFASDGGRGGTFDMPANTVRVVANYVSTANQPTLLVSKDGDAWQVPQDMDGTRKSYYLRCVACDSAENIGKDFAAAFDTGGLYKFPQMPDGGYELYEGTVDGSTGVGAGINTGVTLALSGDSPRLSLAYYTLAVDAETDNHYPPGYGGAIGVGGTASRNMSGVYLRGTTVTLSAVAADGFSFKGWTKRGNEDPSGSVADAAAGAGGSGPGACATLPTAGAGQMEVKALFERNKYAVEIAQYIEGESGSLTLDSSHAGGIVSAAYVVSSQGTLGGAASDAGASSLVAGSEWYFGLPVSLSAAPNAGYGFVGWTLESGFGALARASSTMYASFTPDISAGSIRLKAVFRKVSRTSLSLAVPNTTAIDGGANSIAVDAANLFPVQMSISGLKWFREKLNSGGPAELDSAGFDAAYAGAGAKDKGTLAAGDFDGFAGDSAHRSAALAADENGRYWVSVTYTGRSQDGSAQSYIYVGYVDVKNIYTPWAVYQRDYNVSMDYIIAPYRALASDQGGGSLPAAIPFDLHGAAKAASGTAVSSDVLTAAGAGFRSVTFTPDKPGYAKVYDIHLPGGAVWNSGSDDLTIPLDGSFLGAGGFAAGSSDSGAGLATGHYYSIRYEMDDSHWTDAVAYYVKSDGSQVHVPESGSDSNGSIKVCPSVDG
ncbi:MAG: hypothetical protein LBG50_02250, partial [Clostridiales Family XIII bacterium]|nr:hypothetical protein [Clostridiales Family XIII bacterium]